MPFKDPEKLKAYRRLESTLERTRVWRRRNRKHVSDYNAKYRINHPEVFKGPHIASLKKKKRAEYLESWYFWMKKNGYARPCRHPIKYDYHHRVGEVKSFNISSFIKSCPVTDKNICILRQELMKCDYISGAQHSSMTVKNAVRAVDGKIKYYRKLAHDCAH